MRKFFVAQVGLFLLLTFGATNASGGTLVIYTQSLEDFGLQQSTPVVTNLETRQDIPGLASGNARNFELSFSDELVVPILISYDGAMHPDLFFAPFSVDTPFYLDQTTIEVRLAPTVREDGNSAARAIFNTDLGNISTEGLPEYYQRFRYVALARIARLSNDWEELHDYDVQSVFKYLEIVKELSGRFYLVPDNEVNRARDWLSQAVAQKPDRVRAALGAISEAQEIIELIDLLEGNRFADLWKNILELDDCTTKYNYLTKYAQKLETLTPERLDRVLNVTNVPLEEVHKSRASCLGSVRVNEAISDDQYEVVLEQLETVANSASPSYRESLQSDLSFLRQL